MSDKILSRIEFFNEMRDVLCDEKPRLSASGLVSIKDVLDFIFELGLEEATLFAFEEDEDKDAMLFPFDEVEDKDSEDKDTVSSLDVSDTEYMGCLSSKSKVSEDATPYTIKKQSRWRLIVGIEAKGIEFNAQVGLVYVGDEELKLSRQQQSQLTET